MKLDHLDIKSAIEEALKELGMVNILTAGETGVGKSTLINAVFESRLCATGSGKPITQHIREITKPGVPVSIVDTKGLELKDHAKILAQLVQYVDGRCSTPDATNHIHVAWVCIGEEGRRVQEAHKELVRSLSKKMPVVVVITKAIADQGFKAIVEAELPEARNVIRVNSEPMVLDEGALIPVRGLKDLIDVTYDLVPEAHRRAFASAQKVSSDFKVQEARKVVVVATGLAAAAGATPIPFSDAFVLAPIQVTMLAKIASVFGFRMEDGFLATMLGSIVGVGGAVLAGRALVGGLLKMIPGVGSIAGGAISAATAGAVTTGLGEAFIAACKALQAKYPDNPEAVTAEMLAETFKTAYKSR